MTTTMARIRELFESGELDGSGETQEHGNEAHSEALATQSALDDLDARVTALEDSGGGGSG